MKVHIGSIKIEYVCSKCKGKRSIAFLGKIILLADLGNFIASDFARDPYTCSSCGRQFDLKWVGFKYINSLRARNESH